MTRDMYDSADSMTSLDQLADFIDALSKDAVERGSEWENIEISDMLESMAAWLRDEAIESKKAPRVEPDAIRFVARLLLMGKHYE